MSMSVRTLPRLDYGGLIAGADNVLTTKITQIALEAYMLYYKACSNCNFVVSERIALQRKPARLAKILMCVC